MTTKKKVPSYSAVVGRFIRLEREVQQMTLSTMAKKLGYSTSGWSRVETGNVSMTIVTLRRACLALGRTPSVILKEADDFFRRNYDA
jgi:transcriptional regulator with XRE-family HTH domain